MELNLFKDFLYDLLNESNEVLDLYEDDKNNLLWISMRNGNVFCIQSSEEPFQLFRAPDRFKLQKASDPA